MATLIGADPASMPRDTCPGVLARLQFVHDIAQMHRSWKRGQLHLHTQRPSGALLDCIDAIDRSVSARQSWEIRDAEARAKQQNTTQRPALQKHSKR